jgi:magnesium-transporting ATPase (P-type)
VNKAVSRTKQTHTNASAEVPKSPQRGHTYWRISRYVIFLHVLFYGTIAGLMIAVEFWDWLHKRDTTSVGANLPLWENSILLGMIIIQFIQIIVPVCNCIALYISRRRSEGHSHSKLTVTYLIVTIGLLGAYVASFASIDTAALKPIAISAAFMALPALLVLAGVIIFHIPPYIEGHCRDCGYNLTGNTSGTCPECGNVISTRLNRL